MRGRGGSPKARRVHANVNATSSPYQWWRTLATFDAANVANVVRSEQSVAW